MNCKSGDLAIVVHSRAGHLGKIFQCIRLADDADLKKYRAKPFGKPVWVADREFCYANGVSMPLVLDEFVRPLRDPGPDAVDETLRALEAA